MLSSPTDGPPPPTYNRGMEVAPATSLGLASSLPSTEPLAFSWLLRTPLRPPALSFSSRPKPPGPALVTVPALIIVVPSSGSSCISGHGRLVTCISLGRIK